MEIQVVLLISIFNLLKKLDEDVRQDVIVRVSFLLLEDGLVSRQAVRSSKVVKGYY
jgi:hypothetical protein